MRAWIEEQRAAVAALGTMLVITVVLATTGEGVPTGVLALGVAAGGLLALQTIGLILTARASGFLNLAQIQLGALGGTLFALVVKADPLGKGLVAICPTCTPPSLRVRFWLGLALALALGAAIGRVVELAVVRRLRSRPPVVSVVASIFVLQLLTGLRQPLIDAFTTVEEMASGVLAGGVQGPLTWVVTIGRSRLLVADMLAIGVAVLGAAAVGAWLRYAASGRLVRAVSEAPERAAGLGIPVGRVTGRLWALAGALSAFAAVLTAMSRGEAAIADGLPVVLIVQMLLAATIARSRSLPLAAIAAVLLGVLRQAVSARLDTSLPLDAALVLLVVLTLALQRAERLRVDDDLSGDRGGMEIEAVPAVLRRLPEARRAARLLALALALGLLGAPWVLSPSQTGTVTTAGVYGLVGLSLLVLTGWAGQISLGQFAVVAVGGYVTVAFGLPLLVAIPLAVVAGALVGAVLALPAARLSGSQLAVVTLAFALSVSAVLLNPRYLGSLLPQTLDRPVLLGLDLDDTRVAYYLVASVTALVVLAVTGLRRSRTGRSLRALRDNAAAAGSLGLDRRRAQVTAFAISGAIAGLAGALLALLQAGVKVESFGPTVSVVVLLFAIIGGLASVAGPLLGAAVYALITLVLPSSYLAAVIAGLLGILLLLAAPGGLVEVAARVRRQQLLRIVRRHRTELAGLPPQWRVAVGDRVEIAPPRQPLPSRYALLEQWAVAPDGGGDG